MASKKSGKKSKPTSKRRSQRPAPKVRTRRRTAARRALQGPNQPATGGPTDAAELFRITIEVADIAAAAEFYATLLDQPGSMDRGARCWFRCGAVTLMIVDTSADGSPHRAAKALAFVVRDLDAVFLRARSLGCLAPDDVHGEPAGNIALRPWGERSFYAEDPWGNPLCFVATGTVYRA